MKYPKFVSFALLFIALVILCPVVAHSKDDWLQVRSKNFFLVGNASEKEIRRVATKNGAVSRNFQASVPNREFDLFDTHECCRL